MASLFSAPPVLSFFPLPSTATFSMASSSSKFSLPSSSTVTSNLFLSLFSFEDSSSFLNGREGI
uniref:Uncharacterized protein n=1 Tax=Nelumbo nucifera TaxID=4432 RepID=A0A822ZYZ1_NELNU|nr:TPA_asm: hypothetical protein HUJ06_018678 [Nelumbo nucifera]